MGVDGIFAALESRMSGSELSEFCGISEDCGGVAKQLIPPKGGTPTAVLQRRAAGGFMN